MTNQKSKVIFLLNFKEINFKNKYFLKTKNMINFGKIDNTNKIAERILYRLKQKLDGYENGTQLSCNGQVSYLINEAIDADNLCRIYSGWQPYL